MYTINRRPRIVTADIPLTSIGSSYPKAGMRVESIEPNGGFFRHLLQEISRAGHIVLRHYHYPRWHPTSLAIGLMCGLVLPLWLEGLDERLCVQEFTVGYHVLATRE